jgi:hypothetical protein
MTVRDFAGREMAIGDDVVFITAPNTLQSGIVTGFTQISKVLTVVEIVVTLPDGATCTLKAIPSVCALLRN